MLLFIIREHFSLGSKVKLEDLTLPRIKILFYFLEFLINNNFFQVSFKIFYHVIGIPTESDAAPFFANLFCFSMSVDG